jgi:hypothetical protein
MTSSLSPSLDFNETLLSSSERDGSHLQTLSSRASDKMPGWGISPRQSLSKDIIGIGNGFGADLPDIGCINCEGCRTLDEESSNQCCGCESMAFKYGYTDIPDCEACDQEADWPDWRTAVASYMNNNLKRDPKEGPEDGHDNYTTPVHQLHRRKDGTATMIKKAVSVCPRKKKEKTGLGSPYKYPAFPADPKYQWEGIQGGAWDSISRYWGNSSSICSFWGVAGLTVADREWVTDATGARSNNRAVYQSAYH